MARIRTVKPELWTDPEFVECSPNARLLFVAALNFASDYGVLHDKPVQLKMQCFPGDAIDVAPLIVELVDHGFWVRRTAPDGANVLVIRTFTLHQKVEKPNLGRWGDPANWPEFPDHSPNGRGTVDDHSPPEGKGREGKGNRSRATDTAPTPPDLCLVPPPQAASDHDFEAFWAAYPRKKAKPDARKAYARARKSTAAAVILAGVAPVQAAWNADATARKFIPYPATWLNGNRWADEPDPIAKRPPGIAEWRNDDGTWWNGTALMSKFTS